MKKTLALILIAVLMVTLSICAYAEDEIVTVKECGNCGMILWDDRDQLPDDKKEAFADAKARLEEPLPAEYFNILFAFHSAEDGCDSCDVLFFVNEAPDVEAAAGACEAYEVSAPVKKDAEVIARQLIDGEWVRKEAAFDGKTILVKDLVDAPTSLYQWVPGNPADSSKPIESPHADPPEMIFTGCDNCKIVSWRNRDILAPAKKANLEEARQQLREAVPEGFACRDLVYQDVNDDCTACDIGMLMVGTEVIDEEAEAEWVHEMKAQGVCSGYRVSLSLEGVSDVAVKQYINKEWVEKEVVVDLIGNSVIIEAVVDGPVAIFMK